MVRFVVRGVLACTLLLGAAACDFFSTDPDDGVRGQLTVEVREPSGTPVPNVAAGISTDNGATIDPSGTCDGVTGASGVVSMTCPIAVILVRIEPPPTHRLPDGAQSAVEVDLVGNDRVTLRFFLERNTP
jgi:hypothetical protein